MLFSPALREFFGEDIGKLLKEQLQSDEESTDSEMGELEKSGRLRVIRPSWRSKKVSKQIDSVIPIKLIAIKKKGE